MSGADALPRVPTRQFAAREPRLWFAFAAGDVPLVETGQRVEPDSPLFMRLRHPSTADAPLRGASAPAPGTHFDAGEPIAGEGRGAVRFENAGRVLYRTSGNRLRSVVGRLQDQVLSPVGGVVVSVGREGIALKCDGIGLLATFAVGEPAHGPLVIAVDGPDAEIQAARVDARSAGAILVVGARVDVETLTRARAMGMRGMITGGMTGKDLRDMAASIARQEAALRASPPFALVVIDGYGKRPIPEPHWECLVAAAGTDVGLAFDPPMIVLDAGQTIPSRRPDRVRVTAGELIGRSGRIDEFMGLRRRPGGALVDCAQVTLDAGPSGEPPQAIEVPLADLERYA